MAPTEAQDVLGVVSNVASSPIALPIAAGVAAVTVIAVAGKCGQIAWEHYNEKKHQLKIEKIMRLYQTHFVDIPVYENKSMRRFSPIFIATKDPKNPWEVGHFTEEELDEMGHTIALGSETDTALSEYKQSIIAAIGYLRAYYKSHPDRKSTTLVVLQYLMSLLNTRCLNFEDYESAEADLNAIANFIDHYASIADSERTVHFSRLKEVYPYVEAAKQCLHKHKENRSLEELVAELRSACINHGSRLIRKFTELIIPARDRHFVADAGLDKLMNGVLHREYIGAQVWGVVTRVNKQRLIPESRFKEWLAFLIKYFFQARNPDVTFQNQEVLPPEKIFTLPDLELLKTLRQKKSDGLPTDLDQINDINDELDELREQFEIFDHFITMQLDPIQAERARKPTRSTNLLFRVIDFARNEFGFEKPLFVPVSENETLIERSRVFVEYATLIHKIVSLEYLCTHLLKTIKQLGEIRVNNPSHFCKLFKTLEDLCGGVGKSAKETQALLVRIQQSNQNEMQLYAKQTLQQSVDTLLTSTQATIVRLGASVQEHRARLTKEVKTEEMASRSLHQEMMQILDMINGMYRFATDEKMNESQVAAFSVQETFFEAVPIIPSPVERPVLSRKSTDFIRPPIQAYPKTYGTLFSKMNHQAASKGYNASMQMLLGIRELMNDYTKNDIALFRFFAGHWNRHHIDFSSQFVKKLDKTIAHAIHGDMVVNQDDVMLYLQQLIDKKNEPGVNPTGSLAWRIDYILAQCEKKGIYPVMALVTAVSYI